MNLTFKRGLCRSLLIIAFLMEQIGLALALMNKFSIGVCALLVSVLGVIALQRWYEKLSSVNQGCFRRYVKLIIVTLIGLLIVEGLLAQISVPSANQQFINKFLNNQSTKWLMIIIGIIIAPITEEGAFRTGIMGNTNHPLITGGISTVLFVAVHMTSTNLMSFSAIMNILQYTIISIVLCTIYYKTGNWKVNTVTHIIWNFIGVILHFI